MQNVIMLRPFLRPAVAGRTARIWQPRGLQLATIEPAAGKRGFAMCISWFYIVLRCIWNEAL